MNGLICFLGNIFKNNVLQRLPFTWGVSTQSLGSSWLGALKFWNLNILSHCPFWLLTLVFSSLSQFLSFSFLTLFSLCILFLFASCSLFSTRWAGTGDLEGVRDVDEHFGEPALLQRVEKSFPHLSSVFFQFSERWLLFSHTKIWLKKVFLTIHGFSLHCSQPWWCLLAPVTSSPKCTHPVKFTDTFQQDPVMQGSCMNIAMGRVGNSQAYQSHSIPPPPRTFPIAVVSICLSICWNEKHSCTDFKQTKRKKKKKKSLSFLAEQKCAVNTWRLKTQ